MHVHTDYHSLSSTYMLCGDRCLIASIFLTGAVCCVYFTLNQKTKRRDYVAVGKFGQGDKAIYKGTMYANTMTQPSSRRTHTSSKPQPLTRSGSSPHVDRLGNARPYKSTLPSSQQVNIHRTRTSNSDSSGAARRRSSSLSRRPAYQVQTNNHQQYHQSQSSPHYFHYSRPEGSDTGSVTSAPSLKHGNEFRDPTSSTSRPSHRGNHFRDESPVSIRKAHHELPQKFGKMAKKVIEGENFRVSSSKAENSYLTRIVLLYCDVELSRASDSGSPEKRIVAITNACAEFDHTDEIRHNSELQHGAASILSKILSGTDDEDEIRMVCSAMEMVFRAQMTYVHVAFDKCGSVMMPNLLRIMERAENGKMKHAGKCFGLIISTIFRLLIKHVFHGIDVSILNISKTLLYISRVSDLKTNLARNHVLLEAIKRTTSSILNPDSRVVRVRIAANLVNCDENKAMLLENHGFLDTLLRIAHLDLADLAREYAGVALMDLASSPANQIPMAKNEKVLGTLVKMVLVEKVASARESAITAIQNLAFTKENRSRLVLYKEGIVLEALRKALSGDKNDKARRRAAGALTNLACDETAEMIGNHKGLLDTLAVVSTKDENKEVQTRAAMALTKLAASITIKMASHDTLLDALVVASLSPAANSVSAVLRVKARDPENRESMARHPGVLDTLADICISSGADIKDKDNAMRALMHLTNESNNRKAMCNKKILEALVKGASLEERGTEEIRDSAIRAIERLATEFSNRAYMARHDGLLVAVAKATEREAKLEDSGAKAEHAFLAKPLLMSLLVAM